MKEYLKTLSLALGILFILFIITAVTGLTVGDNDHDFGKQHVKFIEYIRNFIFATKDLKPQITMNYGLGQSFAALYYHGMYNPYVMFSLILGPFVSIKLVMYFIYTLIIGLTSVGMHALARLNKFNHFQARVISMLTTFSGVLIFHLSWHPMFIYYYPFMILSLVSIHKLVMSKNIYYYALAFGLVFYTNFFFAPIVSIIQFLYFIGLVIDENQNLKLSLIKFFKAYALGVFFGALFLIPVYLFAKLGVRGANDTITVTLFNNYDDLMVNLLDYKYVSGIGIVPLLATIYGLSLYKHKRLFFPVAFLGMIFVFNKLVLLLNLNMYNEFKFLINFIPLLWLIIGHLIFKERVNLVKIGSLFATIILVLLVGNDEIYSSKKAMLLIELVLLYVMSFKADNKQLVSFVTLVIVAFTLSSTVILTKDEDYLKASLNQSLTTDFEDFTKLKSVAPYRSGPKDINSLSSLKMFSPNIYTSLENGNYEKMINEYLELENADPARYHRDTVFANYFMRNFLAIKVDENGNETNTINPMVYGVANKDVYSLHELENLDGDTRLLAINQAVFINGESKNKFKNKIDSKLVYASDKEFSFKKGKIKKTIAIPKAYQKPGVLRISADTDLQANSEQAEDIVINKHFNIVRMNDYYGKLPNKEVTFLFDTSKELKELNLEINTEVNKGKPITYDNLKVEFFAEDEIVKEQYQVYKPSAFKVDLGHKYQFTINQEEAGYLATTIPYDPGFTIMVDGKPQTTEQVNGLFLGTKLDAGEHEIVISYQIKGFKLGLVITFISTLIIAIGLIKQRK